MKWNGFHHAFLTLLHNTLTGARVALFVGFSGSVGLIIQHVLRSIPRYDTCCVCEVRVWIGSLVLSVFQV
jgi:hypothetical protein